MAAPEDVALEYGEISALLRAIYLKLQDLRDLVSIAYEIHAAVLFRRHFRWPVAFGKQSEIQQSGIQYYGKNA